MIKQPHDALILAIETGTASGGIALLRRGVVTESEGEVSRAETVLFQISKLLDEAGFRLHELDRLAVSVGPGSFTGIRIGIATALGLRRSIGADITGVDVLRALASVSGSGSATSALPIGRGKVAVQDFVRSETSFIAASDAKVLGDSVLLERIASCPGTRFIVAAKDASPSLLSHLRDASFENVSVEKSNLAAVIARFAARGGSVPLEPIYLRP